MKRVICLIVATLLATVMIVPPAAAQGQNGQQAQDRLRQAQQYMQSPEGQQALQQGVYNLQQARDKAQEYMQSPEGQQALQQVQDRVRQAQERLQQAQQYMQSPEGQQTLQQAWDHLQQAKDEVQQALQQFQKSREGAQEEMKEGISTKIERTIQKIPKSGGVPVGSVFLPAAALLLGSGVLAYAVLRRRR